jgi:23S rRNA (pseudouridine1915-N3)-methyltransferase
MPPPLPLLRLPPPPCLLRALDALRCRLPPPPPLRRRAAPPHARALHAAAAAAARRAGGGAGGAGSDEPQPQPQRGPVSAVVRPTRAPPPTHTCVALTHAHTHTRTRAHAFFRTCACPQRAVPIRLVCVSKGGGAAFDAAVGDYTSRLRRFVPFEEVTLKPNPKGAAASDAAAQMAAEGERVVRSVGPRDRLVLLCERGRDVSTADVAALLAAAGDAAPSALVFAIGGPFGHGPAVRARADDAIRVSSLVLNHQVARLVLAEQLYRAWTILKGEPYHHA